MFRACNDVSLGSAVLFGLATAAEAGTTFLRVLCEGTPS